MENVSTHISLLIASVFIVYIIAITQNVTVFNKEELRMISCGSPLEFIIDDQSWRDPPYPWTTSCGVGEFGDPVVIDWLALLGNVIIYYILLNLLFNGFVTINSPPLLPNLES